jgi:hypothetical protein
LKSEVSSLSRSFSHLPLLSPSVPLCAPLSLSISLDLDLSF